MDLAVTFTNFGPYHLARLRALALRLARDGGRLIAYELAGAESRYPWQVSKQDQPFAWKTLFPADTVESLLRSDCSAAMLDALRRDRPDAVAIAGYARPESTAALAWANRAGKPCILMSETGAIDHPRVWWKEAVKRRRVRRCDSALVGGPRHRDYLIGLGMPAGRIALGYNAVDNDQFARRAACARQFAECREGMPGRPYFLAVNRFVPEKNLARLVRAFARYRASADPSSAWDLALCGGGPGEAEVDAVIRACGVADSVHRPGFLQVDGLARWYAYASAFVHPSLMEPWGLVVNEAAACGLPLLITDRAGCVDTLVPDPPGATGRRFDPRDEKEMAGALGWIAGMAEEDRRSVGRRAADVVAEWGPARFAEGMVEALRIADAEAFTPRPDRSASELLGGVAS